MSGEKPTFWELLRASIILQSLLTTGFAGIALYLWATGQAVPDGLLQGLWAILGFWFGTKAQHVVEGAVQRATRGKE